MTKQEKIQKMLDMQKQFIEKEQKGGVTMKEYFAPDDSSLLKGYRQDYMKTAMEVVDEAHTEAGTKR